MFPVFKIIPDKDETHAGSIHGFRMNTDKIYITVVLCLKKIKANCMRKCTHFKNTSTPPFSGQRPHRRLSVCIYSVKWFIFYHHTGSSCTNCMPHPINCSLRSLTLCLLIGDITTQQIREHTAHPLFTQFVVFFPVMILCHPYCRKLDRICCTVY